MIKKTYIDTSHFSNIDVDIGLMHMAWDEELYFKILHNFYNHYKDFNLEHLNEEDIIREIHTINSLSANIGAKSLYTITTALDKTHNEMLLPQFYIRLNLVIEELKTLQDIQNTKMTTQILKETTQEHRDELFHKLKIALENELPKNCYDAIKTLQESKLSPIEENKLTEIQECLNLFEFEKATLII